MWWPAWRETTARPGTPGRRWPPGQGCSAGSPPGGAGWPGPPRWAAGWAVWQELVSLLLPVGCCGCGRGRTPLCEACRGLLASGVPRRVRPWPVPVGLPPVYAGAVYADEMRAVLLAHKERGALPLARPLGAVLAAAVAALLRAPRARGSPSGGGTVQLVPVPSARRAVARRGHDPVRRIALAAAARLRRAGLPVRVDPALRRRRPVADQATLGGAERRANLAGALTAAPRGGRWGGPVVLVDDLVTTGASLAEAARAVRAVAAPPAAGAAGAGAGTVLGAAVIAAPEAGR